MPLLVRIIARFTGHAKVLPGPYTLGRYGIVLNVIGLVFLLFASITFNFPTVNPVDYNNMNYTSAAIGVIGLISLVTWLTTGRKNFTGPGTGMSVEGMAVGGEDGSVAAGGLGVGPMGSAEKEGNLDTRDLRG